MNCTTEQHVFNFSCMVASDNYN